MFTVRRQLATVVHTTRGEPDALVETLLSDAPPEDPAWVALKQRPTRLVAEEQEVLGSALARLRWTIETYPEETAESDDPAEVQRAAEERLFAAPMTSVTDATRTADVVILDRDHEHVAPAFQFDAGGELLEEVAEVNRVLGADEDPWGVASWWLSPHAALHAIPADIVSLGSSDDVLAAARATSDLP